MSDLASLLATRQRLELEDALRIIIECCTALATGEHRGISPAMITVSPAGEIAIATSDPTKFDFGYVAPEVVDHARAAPRVTARFDGTARGVIRPSKHDATDWNRAAVFSLGCMLWEMLAGRPLFRGINDHETMMRAAEAVVAPLPDVAPELDAIVGRALARSVADRYQTTAELGDALAAYLRSHTSR